MLYKNPEQELLENLTLFQNKYKNILYYFSTVLEMVCFIKPYVKIKP